ncbi:MAG: BON domain-containing protein [Bryobacteraceae bacterium]
MITCKESVLSCVAICAVALLGGCQSRKPVDDASITKNVKAKLSAAFGRIEDRQVQQFDRGADQQTVTYIAVSSANGVVTLTGEVNGKRAKARAGDIARSVKGVARVNNNLSLAPGYSDDAVGDKTP